MASFSDDFNRADSTSLGAGWAEVSGDWSISSNQLSPGAAGGTIILRAATTMASSDHYAQFTIAATTSASQGVWCRGNTNITSGYLWRNDGTNWNLFSVIGGSFTSLGSYTAAAAPGDVAKVQAVGTSIKGFINGVQRVAVTDTNVSTGTSVGVRSESVAALRFDDFSAADVTSDTTLTLTPVTEQSTAQTLTGLKAGGLGSAGGVETTQPLTTAAPTAPLTLSTAIQAARPLAGLKTASLTPAVILCAARPLTRKPTVAPSPERTVQIPAERRRLPVTTEHRTLTVATESRTLTVR